MSVFLTGLGIVVVVFFVIWLINSRAARSIWSSGRAQLGKVGAAALSADPLAVFQQELRDAKDEMSRSISDLEESKGVVSELQELVKLNQRETASLDSKIKASLVDDPNDAKGRAAEYVTKLQVAEASLSRNTEQLTKAQAIYANNLKKFQLAQKKIKEREERGRQLGVEVKSSEMNARLAKLAQKFNVDTGSLDSHLNEAEEELRKKIAKNNAVSEVQTDLGVNGLAEAEEEERLSRVEAQTKLAEYKKKMGIQS